MSRLVLGFLFTIVGLQSDLLVVLIEVNMVISDLLDIVVFETSAYLLQSGQVLTGL